MSKKFAFPEIEPWARPVSGVALAEEIMSAWRRHVISPSWAPAAIAGWVLFAHTFDAWATSPRLAFLSREPECGKTTALTVLTHLLPRPLPTVNITSAALFRIIEVGRGPTLLIDEADTFMEGNEELRGILNSGHTKDTAYVLRCHPETLEPEMFSTWAPLVVAKIGILPPTLHSRSIIIPLRRKMLSERIVRLTPDALDALRPIARRAARWAKDHMEALQDADPDMPPKLGSRAADNWRPLIAIAEEVGGSFPRLMAHTAMTVATLRNENASAAESVIAFIAAEHTRTKRAVPDHVLRTFLMRLVPRKLVQSVIDDVLAQGRIQRNEHGYIGGHT